MSTALITGITGQDGILLTKLLLSKGYKVFGLTQSINSSKASSFIEIFPEVKLLEGNLTSVSSLTKILENSVPDEIYNFGAISFIQTSIEQPELSANVNGLGVLRLLQSIKAIGLESDVRLVQASSSEMFGKAVTSFQNEKSHFFPKTPYGISKVFAHQTCGNYRENYKMNISCAILFSHESEFRGEEFVTKKITKGLAKIFKGSDEKIKLGTLESQRDWGYAGDYVNAMWLMAQQKKADDYVIASGVAHSIRDFISIAIENTGLKGVPEDYVVIDKKFIRSIEVDTLVGDSNKAQKIIGWKPKFTFEDLVCRMMTYELNAK